MGRKEFDGWTDSCAGCPRDVNCVAPIMIGGMCNIPTIYAMGLPSAALFRHLVQYHFRTKGGEWGAVEVERTVQMGMG
jgi:hypothetical protein